MGTTIIQFINQDMNTHAYSKHKDNQIHDNTTKPHNVQTTAKTIKHSSQTQPQKDNKG